MNKKILVTAITLLSTNSFAGSYYQHIYRGKCVEEYVRKIGEVVSASSCKEDNKLELRWATQSYPNLTQNPRRVQYWEGGYYREVTVTQKFLSRLVNVCSGKILTQDTYSEVTKYNQDYKVINPNLDPTIKESFMLVPLTQEEANQELIEARKRCEQDS